MKLHWAGWESDTYQLQQAGWQISAYQDVRAMQIMLAIKHPKGGMRGITRLEDFDYRRGLYSARHHDWIANERHPMGLQALGPEIHIHNAAPFDFFPVDAQPQLYCRPDDASSSIRLDDYAHFAPAPLVRSQVIALPEPSVDELLSRILDMQQAAKTQYFMDQVREGGHVMPAHKFAAQIISLKEAA